MNATHRRFPGIVLLCAFIGAPALALAADDICGEWEMKMDFNGRQAFGTLTLGKKADGTLAGKWGSIDLQEVKFDGGKLTFTRVQKFGDREFKSTYEGTLKDGALAGTIASDMGGIAAAGARRKPICPVLGSWSLKYRIRERDASAVLSVIQGAGGLEAKWTSGTGEHVISDVKFQDGKLTFARKSKMGEREFESTFEGTVGANKLAGTIKGQMGEIPADGERVGADLIGMWEMTTVTDQGTRTSMLRINSDLTGRYEFFGMEIPIGDIKVDGNGVAFAFEMAFGNETSKSEFKGTLDGKTLKGELTTPRGSRQVTGKRVDGASALVGKWEITRAPRPGGDQGGGAGQARGPSTLAIKEDMTGAYTVRDTAYPIADLKLDGDQVSFKVTVKYGEREVPMEFKGTVTGTELKGAFTTSRGVREATGKKLP